MYIVFFSFSVTMFFCVLCVCVCVCMCVCVCVFKPFFLSKNSNYLSEPLKILKFGTNLMYDKLYRVKENKLPPSYHSLHKGCNVR